MQLGCAWNRNDPRLLGKQPSKRELSRCRLFLLREFAEQINQRLVRFTVLWVKAWDGVAEIRVIELRIFIDLAIRKPLPRGLNGTNPIQNRSIASTLSRLSDASTTLLMCSGRPIHH